MGDDAFTAEGPGPSGDGHPVEGYEAKKNPKYEVYTDKAGETRFRLKAANGQIIAVCEGYKAKSSALNGIDSIQRNAPTQTSSRSSSETIGGDSCRPSTPIRIISEQPSRVGHQLETFDRFNHLSMAGFLSA